jgi:hypothetical protein
MGPAWWPTRVVLACGCWPTGPGSPVSCRWLARRSFVPRHDRGQVLTDVAVMLADGGEAIADIDVLRH